MRSFEIMEDLILFIINIIEYCLSLTKFQYHIRHTMSPDSTVIPSTNYSSLSAYEELTLRFIDFVYIYTVRVLIFAGYYFSRFFMETKIREN